MWQRLKFWLTRNTKKWRCFSCCLFCRFFPMCEFEKETNSYGIWKIDD